MQQTAEFVPPKKTGEGPQQTNAEFFSPKKKTGEKLKLLRCAAHIAATTGLDGEKLAKAAGAALQLRCSKRALAAWRAREAGWLAQGNGGRGALMAAISARVQSQVGQGVPVQGAGLRRLAREEAAKLGQGVPALESGATRAQRGMWTTRAKRRLGLRKVSFSAFLRAIDPACLLFFRAFFSRARPQRPLAHQT